MNRATREKSATDERPAFSSQQFQATMNAACDEIVDAADLDDAGTVDALNLLVNATMCYVDGTADNLHDVARNCYVVDDDEQQNCEPLDAVLGWINGA